jgi:hypothetical protein
MHLISRIRSLAPSPGTSGRRMRHNAERHPKGKKGREKLHQSVRESCWRVPKAETTGMDNSIVLKRALLCGRELIVIVAILGRASVRPAVQKGRK